jgi:hypothetical protein
MKMLSSSPATTAMVNPIIIRLRSINQSSL